MESRSAERRKSSTKHGQCKAHVRVDPSIFRNLILLRDEITKFAQHIFSMIFVANSENRWVHSKFDIK